MRTVFLPKRTVFSNIFQTVFRTVGVVRYFYTVVTLPDGRVEKRVVKVVTLPLGASGKGEEVARKLRSRRGPVVRGLRSVREALEDRVV